MFAVTESGGIAMVETGKSFWQTAAGMITAMAAFITAVGGVLAILVQNDLIGGARDERPTVASTPAGGDSSKASPKVTPGQPAATLTLIPWDRATATLVRKDGTSAKVKAATVSLACDTGNLAFKNGQRVTLQLVRSIQFDAIYLENASADGVVTLMDGGKLTDPIHTWNCPVAGTNELGPVAIQLGDIRRIDFQR
jgi:hypothetical protein